MFDFLKVEIALLKKFDEIRAGVFTYNSKEYVGLTDGYICVCIPTVQCYLDISKFKQADIQTLIDSVNFSVYKPVILNDLCKREIRRIVLRFDGAAEPIYIDERYLKIFSECDLFGKDGKSALIAKNDMGETVGLIMPIRGEKW